MYSSGELMFIEKIANPSKYVDDWDIFAKEHQQNLLNHWQKEISNFTERINILNDILKRQN